MTTHRTYSCNLCRERIADSSDGIGLYFTTVDSAGRFNPTMQFRQEPLHQAETHVCRKCLHGLTLLVQQGTHHVLA